MTLRKTIADLITDLSNPAPIFDPEDDFYEETGAKVVGGSFDEEGEDEDIHPSLESGRLRRRAASPLEERDVRYEGKKTLRKNLVEDESDEETSEEEENSEDGDLTSFKEMMKKKQQQRSPQRKPKKFHPGIKEDGDDGDDSDDEEDTEEEEEEEEEEVSGEEQHDDEDRGLQSDEDDEDDELEESKDVYRGQIWERLRKMKESEEEGGDLNEADEDDASGVEDEDDDESIVEEEEEEEEEARDKSDDDDETDIDVVSKVNLNEEIEKGVAAKNQQGLWDNFLESRIKLQKALQLSNQLPQYTTHHSYLEMEDDNEEHIECVLEGQQKLKRLLKVLCKLQDELLFQNPETRHVVTGEKQKTSDSDEEIPSDEDELPDTADEKREAEPSTKRKIDLTNPGEELAKRHKRFAQYRDTVIHSWYDKTKLASGKLSSKSFSAFEKSPVEQVQQILMDKNRLIHRTQLKRSSYKVIGQSEKRVEVVVPPENGEDEQIQTVRSSQLNETDPEIFDDDDFYHQLLKELIERKTADTTDPAQLTRQWLAVQKLRHKVKRVVDTKASKGRKLRYNIHPKMVSFTAPKDDSTMTDEARDELFSSLFGQARILTDGVR
ncbi:protein AATF-like [Apostichopus japonicus]|uniref:protein AATF-like n=1 Tax=Stichopus japonicus TaxID=307972 RepID=UPI003AB4334B